MRRMRHGMVGVILAGAAIVAMPARAQQPVVVEPSRTTTTTTTTSTSTISVPVVPELKGVVTRAAPPAELAAVQQGVVYIGRRGAYNVTGAGQEGYAIFRDGNNRGFVRGLTYYGASGDYWVAAVNGAANTYFAFQARPTGHSPYYQILISSPQTGGSYVGWDEATRTNP